jgi:hypothetical protein
VSSSDPSDVLGDLSAYVTVELSGEAEDVADALIADSLPPVFLDQVDLSENEGMALFLALLVTRRQQASIERDELVAFVERNRAYLTTTNVLEMLPTWLRQATDDDDVHEYIRNVMVQIRYVLDGHPERVDLVSSRLLWLCYALSLKVAAGHYTYPEAQAILAKPAHRSRVTPRAVLYLLRDCIDSLDSAQSSLSEYVTLLAECALTTGDDTCLVVALVLLSAAPPMTDEQSWLDVVERTAEELRRRSRLNAEGQEFLNRARSRYRMLGDEEL